MHIYISLRDIYYRGKTMKSCSLSLKKNVNAALKCKGSIHYFIIFLKQFWLKVNVCIYDSKY